MIGRRDQTTDNICRFLNMDHNDVSKKIMQIKKSKGSTHGQSWYTILLRSKFTQPFQPY